MISVLVNRIREGWRLVTPPVRPTAARLAMFRSALAGARSAMVMGATVELDDMFVAAKVGRIAAFDGHAETIEALRGLGLRCRDDPRWAQLPGVSR